MDGPCLRHFGITLFALLNPLSMRPIVTQDAARETRRGRQLVALFVSVTVPGLLLLFMPSGTALLAFFGVTLNSSRIAAGILRLSIGIGIVHGTAGGGAAGGAERPDAVPVRLAPDRHPDGHAADGRTWGDRRRNSRKQQGPRSWFSLQLALIGITVGVSCWSLWCSPQASFCRVFSVTSISASPSG